MEGTTATPLTGITRTAVGPIDCISQGWSLVRDRYGQAVALVAIFYGAMLIPYGSIVLLGPAMCGVFYVYFKWMRGEDAQGNRITPPPAPVGPDRARGGGRERSRTRARGRGRGRPKSVAERSSRRTVAGRLRLPLCLRARASARSAPPRLRARARARPRKCPRQRADPPDAGPRPVAGSRPIPAATFSQIADAARPSRGPRRLAALSARRVPEQESGNLPHHSP